MSGSMSRSKGKRWERACRKFLAKWMREYTHAGTNEPDIVLDVGGFVIAVECKDQAKTALPAWHAQAEAERRQIGADAAIVLHKRHGKSMVGNAWVTMSAQDFIWWLQQIERNKTDGNS